MPESRRFSFGPEEIAAFKNAATRGAPWAPRISLALALELLLRLSKRETYWPILDEINFLEGLSPSTKTKDAYQFSHPPLHPLWHKHFSSAKHVLKNIGASWGLETGGNRHLEKMINDIAREHGENPDAWPSALAHRLVMDGYKKRAGRLTGDWIIYARIGIENFYLGVSEHTKGETDRDLWDRLEQNCEAEFPFAFSATSSNPPTLD